MIADQHDEYRTWKRVTVRIAGREYAMATKPGTVAYGRVDPAAVLLGERMDVANGDVVVHLHCGNGLVGAVAWARGAARVLLADRNILSVEAARPGLELAVGAPQSFAAPETWYGWTFLRALTPSMDFLYANFETSRTRLNIYAIWFRAMGCYTPTRVSDPPSSGGGEPVRMCHDLVTYNRDTGEIVSVQTLGCW